MFKSKYLRRVSRSDKALLLPYYKCLNQQLIRKKDSSLPDAVCICKSQKHKIYINAKFKPKPYK